MRRLVFTGLIVFGCTVGMSRGGVLAAAPASEGQPFDPNAIDAPPPGVPSRPWRYDAARDGFHVLPAQKPGVQLYNPPETARQRIERISRPGYEPLTDPTSWQSKLVHQSPEFRAAHPNNQRMYEQIKKQWELSHPRQSMPGVAIR
jgi:hypothetical protein